MKKLRSPLIAYSFVLNERLLVPLPAGQFTVGQRVFLSTRLGQVSFACVPNGLVLGRYLSCRVQRVSHTARHLRS